VCRGCGEDNYINTQALYGEMASQMLDGKQIQLICLNCKRENIMLFLDGGNGPLDFIDWDKNESVDN